ncbi:hypothetical protein [Mycobacterium sp. 1274761.0]|uniref:hypothetical protein n=1 Tax=Mycobacterium sp. 1274761.0 TaxID=1834077 RepID=UPI0012E890D2|nr:hypothetical protein [Mycobacterium sp. 1274761.0]
MAGALAACLAGVGGFAGTAAADPESCWGGIPDAESHMPAYPDHRVPGDQDAGCALLRDSSDTSMPDLSTAGTWGQDKIGAAGSYPGHSPAFNVVPQTRVGG